MSFKALNLILVKPQPAYNLLVIYSDHTPSYAVYHSSLCRPASLVVFNLLPLFVIEKDVYRSTRTGGKEGIRYLDCLDCVRERTERRL
jgi:hypothetical protein